MDQLSCLANIVSARHVTSTGVREIALVSVLSANRLCLKTLTLLTANMGTSGFYVLCFLPRTFPFAMITVRPAGRFSAYGRHFNVAIFSDTKNMMNVILCMMVILIEPYPFTPVSVTLIVFKITAVSYSSN